VAGPGQHPAVLDPSALNAAAPAADPPGTFFGIDGYVLLAGLIFSAIGMGAWGYGKKLELWKPKAIGVAMMLYPYFIYNRIAVWAIGVGLCVLLWFHHDE